TAGRLGGGISSAVTIAVTAWVNEHLWPGMGWRVTFWLFGLVGVVWVVFFAAWFRNTPAEHPAVDAAELALIGGQREREASGRSHAEKITSAPTPAHASDHPPGTPWRVLLTSTNLWAFSAMAFCSAFVVYLYFTRFPEYLEDRHHVDKRAWGWVAG